MNRVLADNNQCSHNCKKISRCRSPYICTGKTLKILLDLGNPFFNQINVRHGYFRFIIACHCCCKTSTEPKPNMHPKYLWYIHKHKIPMYLADKDTNCTPSFCFAPYDWLTLWVDRGCLRRGSVRRSKGTMLTLDWSQNFLYLLDSRLALNLFDSSPQQSCK